jgi:hypothetical protein
MNFAQAHNDYLDPDNYHGDDIHENPEEKGLIHNLEELCKARGLDEKTEEDISRNTYKYTDCGASFTLIEDNGIRLSSIVEGVDDYSASRELYFPFTKEAFWDTLEGVCKDAEACWLDTHGCEYCNNGEGETGYPRVNPNCVSCEGTGVVI